MNRQGTWEEGKRKTFTFFFFFEGFIDIESQKRGTEMDSLGIYGNEEF